MIKPEIDTNSIAEIICLGPAHTPGCGVFKGIHELLHGYYGVYENGALSLKQYWRLEDKICNDTFDQVTEKVRTLVLDSIKSQIALDVPMGTLLSGGLDSSIVTAVASKCYGEAGKVLQTFSVDYKDNDKYFQANQFQPGSDQPYIEEMVNFLKVEHHKILLDGEDLASALYAAVDARDLPGMADIDSSLLLLSKEVSKHVKIALSGECADEIFGGYPWYRNKEVRDYQGFPWARTPDFRASFLRPEFAVDIHDYIQERYQKTVEESAILPDTDPLERRMKEMVNLNFQWFAQVLLYRQECMSKHGGLEIRAPFCDHRIAEYLYTIPWEMKDYEGREKGLLRYAMTGLLPDNVLWRKKSPYPKTHNPSYLALVSAMLKEVISDADAPVLRYVRKESLEALMTTTSPTPWFGQLMTTPQTIAYFLQFNYWLKKYNPSHL